MWERGSCHSLRSRERGRVARFARVREGGSLASLAVKEIARIARSRLSRPLASLAVRCVGRHAHVRRAVIVRASLLAVLASQPALIEAGGIQKGPCGAQGTSLTRQPGLRPVRATLAPSPGARCANTWPVCRSLWSRFSRLLASLASPEWAQLGWPLAPLCLRSRRAPKPQGNEKARDPGGIPHQPTRPAVSESDPVPSPGAHCATTRHVCLPRSQ